MRMIQQDWAMAQRAETLRLSGAYEQAIEIFKQLPNKYPNNAWINAHLGATYYQLMNYGKAEEYLKKAVTNNDRYFWAYAQLGETYRLWAIAENRDENYLKSAIVNFKKALNAEIPEDSNYTWALAHLGATYRLEMTRELRVLPLLTERSSKVAAGISRGKSQQENKKDLMLLENFNDKDSALLRDFEYYTQEALKCFDRAIELIPTYAWAWGMRATVYRLAQEYEDSYWDLEVETVIAPEIGILQNSPSPVPFLETRRVNLHEHALLSFYLTKSEEDQGQKKRHYSRAIAYAQQALILQPGDLIARLILTVIEGNQKKGSQEEYLTKPDDIEYIEGKLKKFFEDGESEFAEICQKVLRHLIAVDRVQVEYLRAIAEIAGEKHKLTLLILKDVIEDRSSDVDEEPRLWLWKNYALTQTCAIVLFLLSDFSHLLKEHSVIGKAEPYRFLSDIINRYYIWERVYQTPVLSKDERIGVFERLFSGLTL